MDLVAERTAIRNSLEPEKQSKKENERENILETEILLTLDDQCVHDLCMC